MGRLLVLRHAQSVWNAAGRWQGWADPSLSELGYQQAHQAGRALAASGAVVAGVASSDLDRARTTALVLAEATGCTRPLEVHPELREHNVGDWHGLTTDQISQRWPGQVEALGAGSLEAFPGGETLADFRLRVRRAFSRLAAQAAEEQQGDLVVVSHGGAITALEHWLGVWRPERRHPNLSGWWLQPEAAGDQVELRPLSHVLLLENNQVTGPGTSGASAAMPGTVTEVA